MNGAVLDAVTALGGQESGADSQSNRMKGARPPWGNAAMR